MFNLISVISDEFVEMKWVSGNKKYFIDKGYVFTKMYDIFLVKVTDLKMGSHVLVHVKCDICSKEKFLTYKVYNKNTKNGKLFYGCSDKCSVNKYKKTNLNKYGNEYPMQNKEIREKTKQTDLNKYGCEYHISNKEIREKTKNKNLEKYGVDHYSKTNEFKENIKINSINKYGTENYSQTDECKEKVKQTNLEKYGTENPMQNKEIREKAQQTTIKKYGEIYVKYVPSYNVNSIIYLDMLSEKLNLQIQHGLNGGEKKFVRYWIDGYIEKYNICIEWNEPRHYSKKNIEKDLKKQKFLVENFGCKMIYINEREFLKDVDKNIELLCNEINEYILTNTK